MVLIGIFLLVMVLAFSIMLACELEFKEILIRTLLVSVAVTSVCAMVGAIVGDLETVTCELPISEYEFDSVSTDRSVGYLKNNKVMLLPTVKRVIPSDSCLLVVTGGYRIRPYGWWSPIDPFKGSEPKRTWCSSILYLRL